ncbi:hypothetical protein LXL04_002207 [Taraxacum kok-saghyz]
MATSEMRGEVEKIEDMPLNVFEFSLNHGIQIELQHHARTSPEIQSIVPYKRKDSSPSTFDCSLSSVTPLLLSMAFIEETLDHTITTTLHRLHLYNHLLHRRLPHHHHIHRRSPRSTPYTTQSRAVHLCSTFSFCHRHMSILQRLIEGIDDYLLRFHLLFPLPYVGEKGCWDISETRAKSDRQLLEFLALVKGYEEKQAGGCDSYYDSKVCSHEDIVRITIGRVNWSSYWSYRANYSFSPKVANLLLRKMPKENIKRLDGIFETVSHDAYSPNRSLSPSSLLNAPAIIPSIQGLCVDARHLPWFVAAARRTATTIAPVATAIKTSHLTECFSNREKRRGGAVVDKYDVSPIRTIVDPDIRASLPLNQPDEICIRVTKSRKALSPKIVISMQSSAKIGLLHLQSSHVMKEEKHKDG